MQVSQQNQPSQPQPQLQSSSQSHPQPQQQLHPHFQPSSQKYNHEIGFAIDIDGTLVLSHQQIIGSSQALNILIQNNIPYFLVTNNISKSQQTKADELNNLFKLNKPITSDQIILNITPLKNYMHWKQKIILIVIRQNQAKDRLPFQQIPYYITIDQYCTIFPDSVPLSRRKLDQNALQVQKRVEKRLGLQKLDQKYIKFGAVLVINCPNRWQECYQIIIDLLSSQDGSLHQITQYKYVQNHIPILTALNDLYFRTKYHPLPRILIKPFNQGLKSVYKQIYGKQLKILTFGKPQANTYQFTKRAMQNKYGTIKKIVMIGDNQDTDIKGAYNFGWESILITTTGVSKQKSKLATYNCQTVVEGLAKYGIYGKNGKNGKDKIQQGNKFNNEGQAGNK